MIPTDKLRRAAREVTGFYWGSGLSNEVPALAWFLLASLVPLALGVTALATLVLGDYERARMVAERLSHYLRYVAGNTPVELFLMLSGVLITCYLAALALRIGAGMTMRLQLGRSLGG